jgi:hypothetical protein
MPNIDPDRALDEVPCDFALHLSQRLGVARDEAERMLGDWLERYQQQSYRPICLARVDEPEPLDAAEWASVA